jgi:hypothetical protein
MTPLVKHITEVAAKVRLMAPQLVAQNQKVSLIIFTDGKASDGDILRALKLLIGLPVWLVVRLCTDEDDVGEYWSQIDNDLELPMDVLDDLCGEAKEVFSFNPWLNYGMPIHRMREAGCHLKVFDLLDEASIPKGQLPEVLSVILGGEAKDYPHPDIDKKDFVAAAQTAAQREPTTWDVLKKKKLPYIDVKKLSSKVGAGGCTIA